jgi:hypothetical protein
LEFTIPRGNDDEREAMDDDGAETWSLDVNIEEKDAAE